MSGNRYLIDSNILIYIAKGLIDIDSIIVDESDYSISVMSYMEVLGYPFKSPKVEQKLRTFLNQFSIIDLSPNIIENVIKLKQTKRVKLPDAIICTTAIEHDLILISNDKRLRSIEFLKFKLQPFLEK